MTNVPIDDETVEAVCRRLQQAGIRLEVEDVGSSEYEENIIVLTPAEVVAYLRVGDATVTP